MKNINSRIIKINLGLKLYKTLSLNMIDSISIGLVLVSFLVALFFRGKQDFFSPKWLILLLVQHILLYFTNKNESNLRSQTGYLLFRVEFQSAWQNIRKLSRNFSEIWIQNGRNWR
jgi:hypothetical protein